MVGVKKIGIILRYLEFLNILRVFGIINGVEVVHIRNPMGVEESIFKALTSFLPNFRLVNQNNY